MGRNVYYTDAFRNRSVRQDRHGEQQYCLSCGALLHPDEIGATRKMVNRGATEFYCIKCLASRFGISQQDIRDAIERWRSMGCVLFE